jgi:outer membrane immunogenic protein
LPGDGYDQHWPRDRLPLPSITGRGSYGNASVNSGGWVLGAGLEYALTNNWTTVAEYNHIGIGSTTVPFPTVAVVNAQNISVKQSIDLFKLGVNYKFGWAPVVVARN